MGFNSAFKVLNMINWGFGSEVDVYQNRRYTRRYWM